MLQFQPTSVHDRFHSMKVPEDSKQFANQTFSGFLMRMDDPSCPKMMGWWCSNFTVSEHWLAEQTCEVRAIARTCAPPCKLFLSYFWNSRPAANSLLKVKIVKILSSVLQWVPVPLKTRCKGFLLQLYVSPANLFFLHCSIQVRQTWELLNCKQEQTKITAWWNLDLKVIWLFLWIALLISCEAKWEPAIFFELTKLYQVIGVTKFIMDYKFCIWYLVSFCIETAKIQ